MLEHWTKRIKEAALQARQKLTQDILVSDAKRLTIAALNVAHETIRENLPNGLHSFEQDGRIAVLPVLAVPFINEHIAGPHIAIIGHALLGDNGELLDWPNTPAKEIGRWPVVIRDTNHNKIPRTLQWQKYPHVDDAIAALQKAFDESSEAWPA